MNATGALESIFYIKIPENFVSSTDAFKIDTNIQLPVQKKIDDDPGSFNPSEISTEQILAGILTVLAYDKKNPNLDYYREIILKVKPNIKKELCEAAILKTKNEDFDLAEEIFLSLMGLDPNDIAITLNMALFLDQRADSYRNSGLNEDADAYDADALGYYQEVMNADPPLPDAFFNAGFFYMKKKNYRAAKDAFETYLALTCDVPDSDLGESGVYKKERAQEIITNISNQNIDDEAFKIAYDLISSGQEEKGLVKIREFLETNPKVWNAWFMAGWGFRRLGRYEEAKQSFLTALKNGGESNSDIYNELSICYVEEQNYDEAQKCLMKAMEIEPDSTKIISNLGYIALAQGKKEDARKYFSIVLEIDPKDQIAASELLKLEKDE